MIEDYIGLPYLNGGRTAQGADCYGLVRLIYRDRLGKDLPALSGAYTDSDDGVQTEAVTLQEMADHWEPCRPSSGAVVVFIMARHASHIGMMISDTHFIHTLKGRNSAVERIANILWAKRIYGFYQLRGSK